MGEEPLLRVEKLSKSFPGVQALRDVDIQLQPGEIHGLLGANGAGKSTLVKILSGLYPDYEGLISIDGRRQDLSSPLVARHSGISVVFQELSLFDNLSVAENLFIGGDPAASAILLRRRRMKNYARQVLKDFHTGVDPDARAGGLSFAEKQVVEIAKALGHGSRIIVLDEPAAALSAEESAVLHSKLRRFARDGIGILLVSHALKEVLALATRITVLRDGAVAWSGKTEETSLAQLTGLISGSSQAGSASSQSSLDPASLRAFPPEPAAPPGKRELLRLENVRTRHLHRLSFSMKPGEFVGLMGRPGGYQGEILRVIAGAEPLLGGCISWQGCPISPLTPAAAVRRGMALLSADRMRDGVFPQLSVVENLTLPVLESFSRRGFLQRAAMAASARRFIDILNIKALPIQKGRNLSGGNQQKLLLARWLAAGVKLLLLEEPTHGVDVGGRRALYDLFGQIRSRGISALVCSSDGEELARLCSRSFVLDQGALLKMDDAADPPKTGRVEEC